MNKKNTKEQFKSRVWQHFQSNKSFAVISAYIHNAENNQENHTGLKDKVRTLGLGFTELRGAFTENEKNVEAKTILIANIKKKDAIELGKDFGQFSILYKDETGFFEIGTNENYSFGKTLNTFVTIQEKVSSKFFVAVLKDYFLELLKGGFFQIITVKEIEPTCFNRVAYNSHKPLAEFDLDEIEN